MDIPCAFTMVFTIDNGACSLAYKGGDLPESKWAW